LFKATSLQQYTQAPSQACFETVGKVLSKQKNSSRGFKNHIRIEVHPIPTIQHERNLFLKATLMLCLWVVQGNFAAATLPSNTTTHYETSRKVLSKTKKNNSRGFKNHIRIEVHPIPTIQHRTVITNRSHRLRILLSLD
jgi:hypothetical protein